MNLRRSLPIFVAAIFASTASASPSAQQSYQLPAAAQAVVQRYYAAIEARDYRNAYLLWSDSGRASGKSFANFRRGFAQTAHVRVTAGAPTKGDAGAGSVFVDIPVTVDAMLKSGVHQHFQGTYTLRRVNDIDGATPDQLHWHIASAKLRQTP